MPEIDLSKKIPVSAQWIKMHYKMSPASPAGGRNKPGAKLIARVWSGSLDDAVVIRGQEGHVFIRLDKPQTLSYQRPVTVNLKLKVVAYKSTHSPS